MSAHCNSFGQPIGAPLPDWSARAQPAAVVLQGRFCRLEPLDATRHAAELFAAYSRAPDARAWTYLPVGPFADENAYRAHAEAAARSSVARHYAVIDSQLGCATGTLALMRIDGDNGSIEVGSVTFSPLLQQTPAATEAHFLLMQYAFEALGYRRYEWKCDSLNAPSRKAAARLGFSFEGIFRQAVVYKGRTRDTAWFSMLDSEWPARCAAFRAWLAADNFDGAGRQLRPLAEFREQGAA